MYPDVLLYRCPAPNSIRLVGVGGSKKLGSGVAWRGGKEGREVVEWDEGSIECLKLSLYRPVLQVPVASPLGHKKHECYVVWKEAK